MAYKALYRTYRPSTFDEVAGQQHIIKTLKNALESNKLSHAYLFCGPRGTGKTTMAKLLAKAVNCDEGLGHQCNKCENCLAINNGSHPDVLEIDAASNRGINEIKDLIDKVRYSTILGKKKIYIIDEVHMMTTEAFNALLKTLEEPPEHVIFILATTEPHKLLPTILSRCQRYDFSRVGDEEIKERIKYILSIEQIEYSDDALDLIVSLADGGMRDALSMLDQVIAFSGNKFNVDDVLSIFSLESKQEKISLIHSIIRSDVSDILGRINKYIAKGSDIKRLTSDLLTILKDSLIYYHTHSSDFMQILNEKEASEISSITTSNKINEMITILLDALKDFKTVVDIHTLFEITLLKLTQINNKEEIINTKKENTTINQINQNKTVVAPSNTIKKKNITVSVSEPPKTQMMDSTPTFTKPTIKKLDKYIQLKGSFKDDHYEIENSIVIDIIVTFNREMKAQLLDGWKKIKNLSADANYAEAANLLLDGHVLICSPTIMILELPTTKLVDKARTLPMQKRFQSIIYHLFGHQLFIYAINRSDSVDIQTKYRQLQNIKKLPKIDDINLEMEEIQL